MQSLPSTKKILALTLAIAAIAADFLLIHFKNQYFHLYRILFSFLVAFCLIRLVHNCKSRSISSIFRPNKGLKYWIKATLIFIICDLTMTALFFYITLKLDWKSSGMSPASIPRAIPEFCLGHAVEEELLYRLVLCTPILWLLGPRRAIIISSIVFSILHVVYGTGFHAVLLSFLYGCLFAWAYIVSGSILTTIIWHSFANLIAIGSSLVRWHLIN